jgi:hypothetical protein
MQLKFQTRKHVNNNIYEFNRVLIHFFATKKSQDDFWPEGPPAPAHPKQENEQLQKTYRQNQGRTGFSIFISNKLSPLFLPVTAA